MDRLSALSGVAVPANLASLKDAREIHTGVIDKEQLINYVREIMDKGGL